MALIKLLALFFIVSAVSGCSFIFKYLTLFGFSY